ncbi:MAG: leucine-rich repeat domain-containing protein [Porphyromonadaceae bacterium]|nr:leucine-rich repeat domain-containing protein [Porphyromonadaceae bacterium]
MDITYLVPAMLVEYDLCRDYDVLCEISVAFGGCHVDTDAYGVCYYTNEKGTRKILYSAPDDLSGEYVVDKATVIIAANAFEYSKGVTKVVLPRGLKAIGDCAFMGCKRLEPPEIPSTVEYLGAFSLPCKYETFTIPKSLRQYKTGSIPRADELRSDSPDFKITGDFLLYKDVLLMYRGREKERVTVPDGITVIGEYAFSGDGLMKETVLSQGVTEIEKKAFYKCTALKCVNLPDSLEKIGSYAFYKCVSLKKTALPDNVRQLEDGVFSECTGLNTVKLSASLDCIPRCTFLKCESLKSINIPEGVVYIDCFGFAESGLQALDIPANVRWIRDDAFSGCKDLHTVHIPGSVYVDKNAFTGCFLSCIPKP